MPFTIYRAGDLHNHPATRTKPARRGLLNVGKSLFYAEIEPRLEKVNLGQKAKGYTSRSVEKVVKEGIAEATAERKQRESMVAAAAQS